MIDLFTIAPLTETMRDALAAEFRVHHVDDMDDATGWLKEHGEGVEYVLTDGHYGLDKDYFDLLPNLKLISSNGVGYDAINTARAVSEDVIVTHTPEVLNAEVATTALMLLIACYRDFRANVHHAHSGNWATEGGMPLSRSVDNRTVGILGLGRIGMTIAQKLAPFDARILYHGRSKRDVEYEFYDDFVSMARDADALICVTPGGAGTHHLVNKDVIEALGPSGVLVNVGRGSVVDETALIEALQDGKLGAAGLDVFEDEPNIPQALRDMQNVVLTPHVGSGTIETRAAMAKLAIDNLLKFHKTGTVLTPVPECASLL